MFETAPAWYRPLLQAERAALGLVRDRLPTQAHLHGDDDALADYATSALGVRAAERIVPGANASPYMVEHVARYVWAMDICRGARVADLGSGEGYGSLLLSWVSPAVVGVDRSETAVAHARERYANGAEYRIGDLTDPATLPGADVAVCFEVLEHVPGGERLLEAAAARYPRLLVSFPNPLMGGSHINPHHVNDWPLSALKAKLEQAGARGLKAHHQGFRRWQVRRGAAPWHATWLFDVRF
jgi:SAM-dependent methyltransferase